MNEWSRKRKRNILLLVLFVLIVLIGTPIFLLFYRAPTCFDGKQNASETGVDCGGSCQLLCTDDSLPLLLKGDPRILKLKDNTYEVVALVENLNQDAEIHRARYVFKLFSSNSALPIRTINGDAYVPKGSALAIFEGPFTLSTDIIPTKAIFSWEEESLVWQKNTDSEPQLAVRNISFSKEDTTPRLDALLENNSLEEVENVDLVALISDETGSIFAASKTFVEDLAVGASAPLVFTWPEPFSKEIISTDVIIRILPDRSFIR